MKVAISIPDDIFAEGEALAKRFGASRSEIYRRALDEFIVRHAPEPLTLAMDEVIDAVGAAKDEFAVAASRRILTQTEW